MLRNKAPSRALNTGFEGREGSYPVNSKTEARMDAARLRGTWVGRACLPKVPRAREPSGRPYPTGRACPEPYDSLHGSCRKEELPVKNGTASSAAILSVISQEL